MAKQGKPSVSDATAERYREALRGLVTQAGNQTRASRQLGVSGSAISQLLSGGNRPSLASIQKLAKVLRIPVDQIIGDAPAADPEARYPNREMAIGLIQQADGLPREDVATAADEFSVALHSRTEDMPALWWVDRIREQLLRRKLGVAPQPRLPDGYLDAPSDTKPRKS